MKQDKDQLTVMVCASASGSDQVPRFIIGKAKHPGSFNGVNSHRLRMQY